LAAINDFGNLGWAVLGADEDRAQFATVQLSKYFSSNGSIG
jgi:hypothetical protein